MDNRVASTFDRPAVRVALVALAAFFILFARRYAQMLDPQVWAEEGIIISQIVASGFASIFEPIAGYLLVLPRLLSFVAMLVPFYEYPRVVTLLAWTVTAAILLAIAFVPSRLRGGPLLVIAALLVPSDAEVFGLSLYTFWWSVLLVYAAIFWKTGRRLKPWRLAAIAVGGLSSPAIILAAPLFAFNAIGQHRTREGLAATIVAVACALAQITSVVRTYTGGIHASVAVIVPAIGKFVGGYLIWNLFGASDVRDHTAMLFGVLSLGFVGVTVWRERDLRRSLILLIYLWLGSTALSIARVDVNILDQVTAGPRYFFLPFVMEGWILVQIVMAARSPALRSIAALMLLCAAFNALPPLSRTHDDLAWKASLAACAASPDTARVTIPIESDGHAASHWILPLSGYECKQLGRFGFVGLMFKP